MRTVGIRATLNNFYFAIYDIDEDWIVNVGEVIMPEVFNTSEALKYVRNQFLDILAEYQVAGAGIRLPEYVAQTISRERTQIEAVILEAMSSSNIKSYYEGRIATISNKIGIDRADFKKYVNDEINLELVENWVDHTKEEKEAILTAIGAGNDF